MENIITLKDIVPESLFSSIGTINTSADIEQMVSYLLYNKPFLDHFNDILFSLNGNESLIQSAIPQISHLIENNLHVVVSENLGHTFGTFLCDHSVFIYAKELDYKYIWKFSNDVIVQENILNKTIIANKDFYYINNIGYNIFNTFGKDELCSKLIGQEFCYPQTNYYIIKNNINFYPDETAIYDLKKQFETIRLKSPGIQPWHAIDGCDCEHMLAKTVKDNNLSKEYLLSEKSTRAIIDFIHDNTIYDGSHKNIVYSELGNLCHLQFPNSRVFVI